MGSPGRPATTGARILETLKDYGILTVPALAEILKYSKGADLRQAVQRLEHKKYIARRMFEFGSGLPVAFQLNQEPLARERVAKLLGCAASDLRQRALSKADFLHEDLVSVIQWRLGRSYALVHTVRDWQFLGHEKARRLMPQGLSEGTALPDLAIALQALDTWEGSVTLSRDLIWIGIELERTEKCRARLSQKLSFYAARSAFDGILYLSPNASLLKIQRKIFERDAVPSTTRIAHYPDGFLAQGLIARDSFDPRALSINCGDVKLTLDEWILFLATTKTRGRGPAWDEIKKEYASCCTEIPP